MFKSLSTLTIVVATAIHAVVAQNTAQSAVSTGIATLMLNLEGTHVIPDLISANSLNLSALLMQTFGSISNNPGQFLSIEEAADQPQWSLQYSTTQNSAIENKAFTVMTLDPGAATSTQGNVVRHYLANNVSLTNGQLLNTTAAIAGWFSPAPPPGSGVHRYTTLIFEQPADFNVPDSLAHRDTDIDLDFNLSQYVSQTNLGSIIAANFFLCQNSTAATTSVAPVATSTIGASMISSAASSVSASLVSVYGQSTASGMAGGASGAMHSYNFGYAVLLIACIFAGGAILI